MPADRSETSFLGRVIDLFLVGQLPAFLIALSLAGGVVALLAHAARGGAADRRADGRRLRRVPRRRRPRRSSSRSRRRSRSCSAQIDGVEYVYSMSRPGQAIVTVRFFVGEDRERSLVKLYNKIESNRGRRPARRHGLGGEAGRDRRRADRDRSRSAAPARSRSTTARCGASPRSCAIELAVACRRPTGTQVVGGRAARGARRARRGAGGAQALAARGRVRRSASPNVRAPRRRASTAATARSCVEAGAVRSARVDELARRSWSTWWTAGRATCATWRDVVDGPDEADELRLDRLRARRRAGARPAAAAPARACCARP